MKIYTSAYAKFFMVFTQSCFASREYSGIPSETSSHFYASLLFTKMCTCSNSIRKLCPEPSEIGKGAQWDYASVLSLTRDLVDCYISFYYLCIDDCSKDEWDARWHLFNLHDHFSRKKLFSTFGEDYEEEPEAKEACEELLSNLKNNRWFSLLPIKKQNHFLKGTHPFFLSQDEIISLSGDNPDDIRFKYVFSSNHSHSYPMGFYRMANGERGRGIESRIEVQYTALCLEWVAEILEKAKNHFEKKLNS